MTINNSIRLMRTEDLEQVLMWRNHPKVRQFMLSQHEIQRDEHSLWFERVSHDSTKRLLIFEEAEIPIGFVHFSRVSEGGISDWGFYTAPGAPKGTGKKLGIAALNFAFHVESLHKVCGQALGYNNASIRFHLMLGFHQEGVLREHHRLDEKYHDLINFGILRCEWLANK